MATNKVGLTKLNLKKNTEITPVEWGDQTIEVKQYLPIQEKLDLISRIVSMSLDDNNFANPVRINIFSILEIMYAYTNINFTDKQKEDFLGLYDLIVSSGLWDKIFEAITKDYTFIMENVEEVIEEVYKYKNSVLGILQAAVTDYKDLDLDATKLKEKIGDPENLKLLKAVVDEFS